MKYHEKRECEHTIALSPKEFVQQLNATARFPCENSYQYMRRFATMYEVSSENKVRYNTPEAFVADLQKHGQLELEGPVYTLYPS